MADLQETPATPPVDYGGDARTGWLAGGVTLVFIGWWLGVVVNLLAHLYAPSGGYLILWVHVNSTMGPYAWGILGLGLGTGAIGAVLIVLGRSTPRGPFVLPGYEYRDDPRTP